MPPIALLTDFGQGDYYVAAMKGVLLTRCPGANLVDICHDVAAQDVPAAAEMLADAAPCFPWGTVFLVVVDPGVGSARRCLAVSAAGYHFVAPDNGVLWPTLTRFGVDDVQLVEISRSPASRRERIASGTPSPTSEPSETPVDASPLAEVSRARASDGGRERDLAPHPDRSDDARSDRPRSDRPRSDRPRSDRPRSDRPRSDRPPRPSARELPTVGSWLEAHGTRSTTFHGRDVFAPVAGSLAAGTALEALGTPLEASALVKLDTPEPEIRGDRIVGRVVRVDHYGNCVTNVRRADLDRLRGEGDEVRLEHPGGVVCGLNESYVSVASGDALLVIGSTDRVEVSVSMGSAATTLGLDVGDPVAVTFSPSS